MGDRVYQQVPDKCSETRMLLVGRTLGVWEYERWHVSLMQGMQRFLICKEWWRRYQGWRGSDMCGLSGGFEIQLGLCRVLRRRLSLVRSPLCSWYSLQFHTIPFHIWRFLQHAFWFWEKTAGLLAKIGFQMPGYAVHIPCRREGWHIWWLQRNWGPASWGARESVRRPEDWLWHGILYR